MKTQEKSQLQEIEKAANILKSGGVVIFPTDTVYGIGCIYDNDKAVDRVYKIKGTEKTQAFPVLVASVEQVEKVAQLNSLAKSLISKFWPGGLTLVLKKKDGSQKVGFRMPNSDLVRSLIEKAGSPIVGTSANLHTHQTPNSYEELDPKVTKQVDYVVKGECELGRASTVVDVTISPPKILRQGAVQLNDIEN